jgi:polysaccharide biosynthesis transport protein
VDLRRQIAIVRTWLPLLILCVILAGGAAFAISTALPKTYEAKATLIVGQSLSAASPDYNQLLVSQRLSTTYAAVATTRPILDAVIAGLDLPVTSDELAKRVRADAALDSTLLTITAQDTDPARAAAIANAMAEQLIAASPALQGRQAEFQASIDSDLKATQAQIAATQAEAETLSGLTNRTAKQDADLQTLEGRLVSLRSTYATLLSYASGNETNLLSVVEPAVAPPAPVSPRPLLNALLAAVLGLLVVGGIAFGAEYLDDSIKSAEEVQEVTGLSTLGTIARMKGGRNRSEIYRLAVLLYPRSAVTETYRTLRANIEFASVDAPLRTLLVTSSIPGEGKTVTAANLAVVFAQAGRRVLLVDVDMRKPGVHIIFDLPNAHGLSSLLRSDEATLDAVTQPTEEPSLRILTTGPLPPNPAELIGSQRMRAVLDRIEQAFDFVIFDSPPLQAVTDAAILSSLLDGTLLVIDAGRSHRRPVGLARETLARAGAHTLGVVLNRVPVRSHANYASYYEGYSEHDAASERSSVASAELADGSAHVTGTG